MIAFCTHRWSEIDSKDKSCRYCRVDLTADSLSYEEKLIAALAHPLPEARVRICWLLDEKHIICAVTQLIELAEHDPDLFAQRAAIEAVGCLRDSRAIPVFKAISQGENHFQAAMAEKNIEDINLSKGSHT